MGLLCPSRALLDGAETVPFSAKAEHTSLNPTRYARELLLDGAETAPFSAKPEHAALNPTRHAHDLLASYTPIVHCA